VLDLLPPTAVGLGALAALVALPGMLLVRAPWTAVPALSVSFWILTWWWVPLEGRTRQVALALPIFGLLLLLRFLPKRPVEPPPGYAGAPPPPPITGPVTFQPPRLLSLPSLFVLAVGVCLVAPLGEWANAPGPQMAFQTTATRLLVWRDAMPKSYEPLLPLAPFGVRGSALSTLAADVSLLTGLEPPRAVVAVALLAAALALLGLFALLGTRLAPPAAALGAVLGLAAVRWPGFLAPWGEGASLLALALALPAAALMVGHTSRPSAVGAGFLWAAGALAQPWLTLAVAAVSAIASTVVVKRWMLAFGVATALAAPPLVRLTGVLSIPEALDSLRSVDLAGGVDFALGLAIVVLCVMLAERMLGRRVEAGAEAARATGPGAEEAPVGGAASADPEIAVAYSRGTRAGTRLAAAGLALFSAALLFFRVQAWLGAGQIPHPERVTLARLVLRTTPRDVVCAPPGLVDWVPAVAGRAVGVDAQQVLNPRWGRPWVPPSLREESTARSWPACTTTADGSPLEDK
jgi:hypothetical protein